MAARIDAFRRGRAPLVRGAAASGRSETRSGDVRALRHATGDLLRCALRPAAAPRASAGQGAAHKKIMQGLLAVCKALARASKADEG
jgi:hypothetical protein